MKRCELGVNFNVLYIIFYKIFVFYFPTLLYIFIKPVIQNSPSSKKALHKHTHIKTIYEQEKQDR